MGAAIDKALLARIRKCMALGRSSNEHEAAAALAKARALMEEHGVTEVQLAMAEIEEATARASRTQRPPMWENVLCNAVQHALGVVSFIDSTGDRNFIGRGALPEIAAYAFAVLFRHLKAARADYIARRLKRCTTASRRRRANVYCEAWAMEVYHKVAALVPARAEDALIGQYLATHHPNLSPVAAREAVMKGRGVWDDWARGSAAGAQVELNSGIGGGAPAPMLT